VTKNGSKAPCQELKILSSIQVTSEQINVSEIVCDNNRLVITAKDPLLAKQRIA